MGDAFDALKLNASLSQSSLIQQNPPVVMKSFCLDLGFCKEWLLCLASAVGTKGLLQLSFILLERIRKN